MLCLLYEKVERLIKVPNIIHEYCTFKYAKDETGIA